MQYFDELPLKGNCAQFEPAPLFRSVRTGDLDVTLEFGGEVGITVELSERFSVTRRVGSKTTLEAATFGNVTIDLPEQPLDLSIRGECRIVQFALPLWQLVKYAAEDHGIDASGVNVRSSYGARDMQLLRLLCRGATQAETEDEVTRAIVAHLLTSYSGSRPLAERSSKGGLAPAQLRRVHDFVEANLASATLSGMAAEASLSPFHFAREFRRTTGEAPWSYVVSRRLARAITLLGSSDRPLELIARSAGFPHASHMSRHLRARFGASASRLREHLLP